VVQAAQQVQVLLEHLVTAEAAVQVVAVVQADLVVQQVQVHPIN